MNLCMSPPNLLRTAGTDKTIHHNTKWNKTEPTEWETDMKFTALQTTPSHTLLTVNDSSLLVQHLGAKQEVITLVTHVQYKQIS